MTTTYSRRVFTDPSQLRPGDLVDVSSTRDPSWAAVALVGICADDLGDDVECDGDCLDVIYFDDSDMPAWHVTEADEIYARLLADATQADVDADNVAHEAAALRRAA